VVHSLDHVADIDCIGVEVEMRAGWIDPVHLATAAPEPEAGELTDLDRRRISI
jgi:hypothetical protein